MAVPLTGSKAKSSQEVIKSDKLTSEQQIQKTKNDFLKIMTATLKYQNPEKPADANQIAQTMAIIQQTEETSKMRSGMEKLEAALMDNKLAKALPLQGKNVRLDTSSRNYSGNDSVEFAYQLKYDPAAKPSNATISTILSIYDPYGVKVYETKGKTEKGVHTHKWDGRDSKGRKLPEGSYSLKVSSFFHGFDADGKLIKTPIDAGAFIEGEVESIDVRDGEIRLYIGGKPYSMEDIVKVDPVVKEEKPISISDYANYIGQTAELDDNEINVSLGGNAVLNYKCDIDRPGKLSIHILDNDGLLKGIAVMDGIKKGSNKLTFKASAALTELEAAKFERGEQTFDLLSPGKYKIKLFQQNQLDEDPTKYSEVKTTRKVNVTGLDFSSEPLIVSGSEKFPLSSVRKLSAVSDHETILSDGAKFIGKFAKLRLSKFQVKAGQEHEKQFITIPKPEAGTRLGKVSMIVYDDEGRFVKEVKTRTLMEAKDEKIIYKENLWDFLTDADKRRIRLEKAIPDHVGSDFESTRSYYYGTVNPARGRDIFPEFLDDISLEFSRGTYSVDEVKIAESFGIRDFATLPRESQELVRDAIKANKPATGFYWDLTDSTGRKVKPGNYRYEFKAEKYHETPSGGTRLLEVETIDDFSEVKIVEYRTDKGETKFYGYLTGEDGNPISDKMISFSLDEISSIFGNA